MKIEMSENVNELFAALAKAQGEMPKAEKSSSNPFYKSKFADLASVVNASRPTLSKYGLAVNHITTIDENGKTVMFCLLGHSSGQWMSGTYPLNPVKDDPQGMGSAFSYAKRYTYGGITGVVASDEIDDDGAAASGTEVKEKKKSPFSNAALRNKFVDNVKKSMEDVLNPDELEEVKELNKERFRAMRDGTEHDILAVEELVQHYTIMRKRFDDAQTAADSYNPDFGGIK